MSTEYEASIFAAEYLLDDEDVLQLCMAGHSVEYISRAMGYPQELILLKVRALQFKGHSELVLPYEVYGGFLGE